MAALWGLASGDACRTLHGRRHKLPLTHASDPCRLTHHRCRYVVLDTEAGRPLYDDFFFRAAEASKHWGPL